MDSRETASILPGGDVPFPDHASTMHLVTETAPLTMQASPSAERRTIARLWRDAVAAERAWPAYLVQAEGGWTPVSTVEAAERVDDYANGLLALGIRKGDTVAILAQTTLEWTLFDLALSSVGAIGVPIYASSSPADAASENARGDARSAQSPTCFSCLPVSTPSSLESRRIVSVRSPT